jgi:hypothetical protein
MPTARPPSTTIRSARGELVGTTGVCLGILDAVSAHPPIGRRYVPPADEQAAGSRAAFERQRAEADASRAAARPARRAAIVAGPSFATSRLPSTVIAVATLDRPTPTFTTGVGPASASRPRRNVLPA